MAGYKFVVVMVGLGIKMGFFDLWTNHDDCKLVAGHFLAPPPTLFHYAKIQRGVTKCPIPTKSEEFRLGY